MLFILPDYTVLQLVDSLNPHIMLENDEVMGQNDPYFVNALKEPRKQVQLRITCF